MKTFLIYPKKLNYAPHLLKILFSLLLAIGTSVGCELEVKRKKNHSENSKPDLENNKDTSPPPTSQTAAATPAPTAVPEVPQTPVLPPITGKTDVVFSPLPILRAAKYVLTGLEYGHYQAEVSWTPGLSNISVYINGVSVFSQQDIKNTFCILDLLSDTNYSIRVYTVNDDTHTPYPTKEKSLIGSWEIRTPLDLKLTQEKLTAIWSKSLDNKIEANRIFLEKDGNLITNGNSLNIFTNELFTDRSEISTFNTNQKAPTDTNGRDGGQIIIKSKKAHGLLTINLRGENGGDGIDGNAYTERAAKGPSGENGRCNMTDTPKRTFYTCDKDIMPGGQGAPGANARPGTNGGNGGNTGLLKVEVSEDSPDFLVHVIKTEGLAGQPGKAGPPQLGGLGGDPGHDEGSGYCCTSPQPSNLGEGPTGKPAADGILQKNGLIQAECISVGQGENHC